MEKRGISPLTTWHSQTGLLLISATWGLSYLMPADKRISFSEVFPDAVAHSVFPMWGWGLLLLTAAAVAFIAERGLRPGDLADRLGKRGRRVAWWLEYVAHMTLAATYTFLSVAALYQGIFEVHTTPMMLYLANTISALSRPVLWVYIGYLHTTYARLPQPQDQ